MSKEIRKRNGLSLETRLKIIQEYETLKTPHRDLASKYRASQSQIQRTLAHKSKYLLKSTLTKSGSSSAGNNFGSPIGDDRIDPIISGSPTTKSGSPSAGNYFGSPIGDDRIDLIISGSPSAGNDFGSPMGDDRIDFMKRMLKKKSSTEDDTVVCLNGGLSKLIIEPSNATIQTANESSDDDFSQNSEEENINDNRSVEAGSEVSDVSDFSSDSFGNYVIEPNDVPSEKRSNRLFLEQTCEFIQKKSVQKLKWLARVNKLKRRLHDEKELSKILKDKLTAQEEKTKKFEEIATELKKQKMVVCLKCGEHKPKLAFDFCSLTCFQDAWSKSS